MSQRLFELSEDSQVGELRRQAAAMADALGLDEQKKGKVSIVATELATNIIKHAGKGVMLVEQAGGEGNPGLSMIALDKGRGMSNVAASLRDGHSTAGSAGIGLGSLSRLASDMEIYSQEGRGTAIRCVVWRGDAPPPPRYRIGAVSLPKRGETANGDAWLDIQTRSHHMLLVIDGLGHGVEAAEASRAALKAVAAQPEGGAAELLEKVHNALRATRGAAGAVALVDRGGEKLCYCGVGNIAGVIRRRGQSRSLLSHNGILGHQLKRFQEFEYPFARGATLLMHSDGLGSQWNLGDYPGLDTRHPALAAAVLYRDYQRVRDDVTVAVLQESGRP